MKTIQCIENFLNAHSTALITAGAIVGILVAIAGFLHWIFKVIKKCRERKEQRIKDMMSIIYPTRKD